MSDVFSKFLRAGNASAGSPISERVVGAVREHGFPNCDKSGVPYRMNTATKQTIPLPSPSLGERGDRKAGGEGVSTNINARSEI